MANDDASPSSPVRVPATVQVTSDKEEVAEVTQGASSLPLRLLGVSTQDRCVGHASLFETDPISPRSAPGAAFFQQGWGWEAPRTWGWASRKWHCICSDTHRHLAFKPCTPWEDRSRVMSDSTSQKHLCFHYIAHPKPR